MWDWASLMSSSLFSMSKFGVCCYACVVHDVLRWDHVLCYWFQVRRVDGTWKSGATKIGVSSMINGSMYMRVVRLEGMVHVCVWSWILARESITDTEISSKNLILVLVARISLYLNDFCSCIQGVFGEWLTWKIIWTLLQNGSPQVWRALGDESHWIMVVIIDVTQCLFPKGSPSMPEY